MDLLHMFHVILGIQSFAAMPYTPHWLLWPLYPVAVLVMSLLWLFGQPFAADKYKIPGVKGETWVMPRYRFQVPLNSNAQTLTLCWIFAYNYVAQTYRLTQIGSGIRVLGWLLICYLKLQSLLLGEGETIWTKQHLEAFGAHGSVIQPVCPMDEC